MLVISIALSFVLAALGTTIAAFVVPSTFGKGWTALQNVGAVLGIGGLILLALLASIDWTACPWDEPECHEIDRR
jgi:cytochrome c-type biogenesis protein CcmE